MKGKKFIIWVLAIIMIGAGFFSSMEVVAEELPEAPFVTKAKVEVKFPGGAYATYTLNDKNGCIQDISDREGKIPWKTGKPDWQVKAGIEKIYTSDLINLPNNLQCRQGTGIIGIGSSPIEYYSYDSNGNYICVGAWDSCNSKWYDRCQPKPYPNCP